MRREYKLNIFDGHLLFEIDRKIYLVDTGSPASISRTGRFLFAGEWHECGRTIGNTDIDSISRLAGFRIDILIGMDLMKSLVVRVDMESSLISFSDEESDWERGTGRGTPLDFNRMGFPVFRAVCRGRVVRLVLDTGARISYLTHKLTSDETAIAEREDFSPFVGQYITPIYNVDVDLEGEIIPMHMGNLPMVMDNALSCTGIEGVVGYDLFRNCKVEIDFPNGVLRFLKYDIYS